MAEKTMDFDELRELSEDGFEIEFDKKTMVIDQFGDLIEKLEQMVAANEERTRADLARSQTQLEVLATLQSLIKQQGGVPKAPPIDLAPLQTVLTQIQEASAERGRVAYEFDVQRSGQGYISKIVATPQGRTLN